ncbi:MAG: hydrogenase maturation protease [Phycisphaerales bacterium]|nr:MAG: hydrogenase maturation protease [Phycisphaerales bacterium]
MGNILLRDEGVGVRVVEAMERLELPPEVELFDGATAGLDLVDVLADRCKVIVIDAIDGDSKPGTVLRLTPEDVAPQEDRGVSLHEIGLLETLMVARQLGVAPQETIIFGVKPHDVGCGLDLSAEMARLVPRIIGLVLAELANETGADVSRHAIERED